MKYILLSLVTVIIVFNGGCAKSTKSDNNTSSKSLGNGKNLKLNNVLKVKLKENKYQFTMVSDLAVGDQAFFISCSDPPMVIKYNFGGKQIKKIGASGRGPFEYVSPSQIELKHGSLFVWDSSLLRLSIYSNRGKKIDEEAGLSQAIADFKVTGNKIAFYFDGKRSSSYIKIYNLGDAQPIAKFGTRDAAHDLLMMYKGSGGLAFLDANELLYGSPSSANFHLVNLRTKKDSLLIINESKFKVQTVDIPEYHSGKDLKEVTAYLFNNSRLSGIYVLKNYIIVELQVGKTKDKTRADILYIYNKSLKKIGVVGLPFSFLEKYGQIISAVHNNTIYYLNNYSSKVNAKKQGRILTGWKIVNKAKK
jgi:hypothetical protein